MTAPGHAPAGPRTAARPCSRESLRADLRALGVREGDPLLVHSSLRSLGFVIGGAAAVVRALLDAVGDGGTVVAPAFTAGNTDPHRWPLTRGVSVPSEWWPEIRAHLPPFDVDRTPSEGVGVIAETLRQWPGAVRSAHPQTSFCAVGARAVELMDGHARECHLGPDSPLGKLATIPRAKILLMGVSFGVCTAFHLGEYLLPDPPRRDYECVISENGERRWFAYRDVALVDADFEQLGAALEQSPTTPEIGSGKIGAAPSRLLSLPKSVAFARDWLAVNRQPR